MFDNDELSNNENLNEGTNAGADENSNNDENNSSVNNGKESKKETENLNRSNDGSNDGADNNNDNSDDSGIYGAPEAYDYKDIKLPEGYEYDKDMLNEFNALNKETNLSQAQANKYMEFGIKLAQKQSGSIPDVLKQVQQAKIAQYQQALNTDAEIGGGDTTKMNAYLDVADKGYAAFANDEVKAVLADAGLNYHPAVVKMFHRIGELVGDDKIFAAKTPSGTSIDAADVLYGSNGN